MLVSSINSLRQNSISSSAKKEKRMPWSSNSIQDNFSKSEISSPQIYFENGQKIIKGISFGGFKLPKIEPKEFLAVEKPAIQMRVTGVIPNQDNMKPELMQYHNFFSINKLSDGPWKDEEPMLFQLDSNKRGPVIKLFTKEGEEVGRVPDEITPKIYKLLKENPNDFNFQLSNLVAGKSPGAPTIGMRVNFLFTGTKNKIHDLAQTAFDEILNDPKISKKAFFYQPKKSPDEVLEQLYQNVLKEHGPVKGKEIVDGMKKSLETIIKEIEKPENKKILVTGHVKVDGDDFGSGNGFTEILKMLFPEKQIDFALADEIPGLFRDSLPGAKEVKHPYSQEHVNELENKLAKAIKESAPEEKIKSLQESLKMAKDPNLLLNPKERYDAVILFDTPSPARFTSAFKKWFEEAKTMMYIDHHPLELEKWDQAKNETGVDMKKIINNNLAWVADQVAAASQMAVILASKLKHEINPLNPANYIKTVNSKTVNHGLDNAIKSFVTGIWTDTSGFSRTANLLTKDVKDKNGNIVPVQNRPNYYPEGMAKWLFSLTNGRVDKKWFHDNVNFVLAYREKMIDNLLKHRYSNPDIGFGYTKASYNETIDILEHAQVEGDGATNFSDVVNEMKLSEVMGQLRESSKKGAGNSITEKINETPGLFDEDKIAVFISESEKAGERNTEGKISENNALRFSFRSADGTDYAEFLAGLFSGGGHGPAAGGHLIGKTITLNSTFKVHINGQPAKNIEEIYNTLQKNFEIKHDPNLSAEEAKKISTKIEVLEDENGQKPEEIMEDVVKEIRTQKKVETDNIFKELEAKILKSSHHQKVKKNKKKIR